jgi:hypothetical protein
LNLAMSEAAYQRLSASLARLNANMEQFATGMESVTQINDATTNLAVIFGTLFASVPGIRDWVRGVSEQVSRAAGSGAKWERGGGIETKRGPPRDGVAADACARSGVGQASADARFE